MCRLFGLTAGRRRVRATFWLLDAPDNLSAQSHRNPDGTGLGTFDLSGRPVVEKQPLPAYDDPQFASESRERESSTFLAHVRRSSGAPVSPENTHPFEMDGRLFAHNGVIGDTGLLDQHLGDDLYRVHGQTDSERLFAAITRETAGAGGDLETGILAALGWVSENLSVQSANFVLTTPTDLWALRLPAHNELWLLDRRDQSGGRTALEHRSTLGTRVRSDHLAEAPAVVIASEPLDREDWRLLDPGELVHVDTDLEIHRRRLP